MLVPISGEYFATPPCPSAQRRFPCTYRDGVTAARAGALFHLRKSDFLYPKLSAALYLPDIEHDLRFLNFYSAFLLRESDFSNR